VTQLDIVEAEGHLGRRLRQRPPVIAVSAKTGRGIGRLLDKVEGLFEKHNGRITTGELNRALGDLREARLGPLGERGRRLKLMYGTQVSTRPPRFRIFVNAPSLVTRDYGYWVENELRKRFALEGVPVSIDFVKSE
jgi:GTP-binding protein